MTPEEMKQKLDEADRLIEQKLREFGFTPEEIQRVLDRSLSKEQRDALIKEAMQRHVQAQLHDPKSPLFQTVLDQVGREADKLEAKLVAEKRRKRRIQIATIAGCAIIGAAVFYVVNSSSAPNRCETLLGPLDRIAATAGFPLRADKPIGKDDHCELYVWAKDGHGNPMVIVENARAADYSYEKQRLEKDRFASHESVQLGSEATLFVASDAPDPSTDEMMRDAQARVGKSADPTGDMLGSLPPPHHIVIVKHGTEATKLSFERKTFTPAKVKALAAQIVATWK